MFRRHKICHKIWKGCGKSSIRCNKIGKHRQRITLSYEDNWRKEIKSKINSAGKVQDRWIGLTDEEWDKELDIIKEIKTRRIY